MIVDGGDQPNVVPPAATVWYFVREIDAPGIRQNFDTLQKIAEGAALMTDTALRRRIVGAAWPRHFNRPMALAMQANIEAVGMPRWSEQDQTFARALQQLLEVQQTGLPTEVQPVAEPSRNRCPAAPTTSATSRGSCRRRSSRIRRTCRA